MGQIWLHIGSPKTGTTSLQGFLNDNQDQLRDEGDVNFMASGRSHIAHNQLAAAVRMGDVVPLFDQMQREADTMPDAQHVVTSELLFNPHTTRKLVSQVPDTMKQRTKVICYIRRQDSYLEALYKQFLKNSRIVPDRQAFLGEAPKLVRYLDVINAYGRAFGPENVVVRPFSTEKLTGGDVVLDFADQLGIEILPGMKLQKSFANKTFSAEMSEVLATLGEQTDFNIREVIRELIAIDHPGTIRSRDVFTRAERHDLMEKMASENRKLVRRYMPEHSGFFSYKELEEDTDLATDIQAEQLADRAAATEAVLKAIGNLQRRRKEEAELTPEPPKAPEPITELEEQLPASTWYREIYPAGERDGWFHKFGDYSCSFVERSRDQLVVSFDNLSQAGNEAYAREPWAQKFCEDRGYSHVGVYAQSSTWFRNADLIAFLEQLRNDGFFKRFWKVSFVGTSMGAFGALTFSSLSPGCTVVAFSPQTTLDEAEVPWETRFGKGRAADWSLPYSDAATQTMGAEKVYLIYDPFHQGDRAHVERLYGPNLVHLRGFGIGHKSALVLNRMEALKPVMELGITGQLKPHDFYKAMRARKDIYIYRTAMEGYLKERGQTERLERFANAFKRRRRAQKAA